MIKDVDTNIRKAQRQTLDRIIVSLDDVSEKATAFARYAEATGQDADYVREALKHIQAAYELIVAQRD